MKKVEYQDQAEKLDNDTTVMDLFLVCVKLYKSELMQVQLEAEVNNTEIIDKNLIRHMNVAWRIKSDEEGVAQVGESEAVLTSTEFKEKCHTCGKYRYRQNKCPKKNKCEEEKGNKKFTGKCNQCGKVGQKTPNCCEHEAGKDTRPQNWKKKEEKEVGA